METKKLSLVKPTQQTPFHIDFNWWRESDRNWHVDLHDVLCPEHQQTFASLEDGQLIDWVDTETAEVRRMDGLQNALIDHCSQQPGFLGEHTTFVDGVFRLLLANGNAPMNAVEIAEKLHKPADTILRTLSGPKVYKGIRPYYG